MRQVADETWRLGSRGHNYYLLREGDEFTLIDAGCSREWKALVSSLETLGVNPDAIAGVVVTHSHADHFGFAKMAGEQGLPVSVHEDEETRALGTYGGRYAASASDLPFFNLRALWNFIPMIVAGVMSLDHVDAVGTFSNGEQLALPGAPVAVHTPGHTEGHTMFHCPDRGLLFTGDGLVTMDLLGSSRGPQIMDEVFHLDATQVLESLDRITGIQAELLLPGHGDPWEGSPADAVALARS